MSKSNLKKMKGALSDLLERYHREFRRPTISAIRQSGILKDLIILSYRMISKFDDLTPPECREVMHWYDAFTRRFTGIVFQDDEWALGPTWWREALAQTSTINPRDMEVLYQGLNWDYNQSVKPIFDESSTVVDFKFMRDEVLENGEVGKVEDVLKLHMISAGEFPIGSYWFHKRGTIFQLVFNDKGESVFEGATGEGPTMTHEKVRRYMTRVEGVIVRSVRGNIDWKVTSIKDWVAKLSPVPKGVCEPIARYVLTMDRLWNPKLK